MKNHLNSYKCCTKLFSESKERMNAAPVQLFILAQTNINITTFSVPVTRNTLLNPHSDKVWPKIIGEIKC